jgi:hypothetical protein
MSTPWVAAELARFCTARGLTGLGKMCLQFAPNVVNKNVLRDRYNIDADEDLVDAAIKIEARSESIRKVSVEAEDDEDIEDAVRE